MKTTIKLILLVTLFFSTSSISLADGDQTSGGGCTIDCSIPTDPTDGTGESFNNEAVAPASSTTTNDGNIDLSEDIETISLINWLLSFFG